MNSPMQFDARSFYETTREAQRVALVDMGFLGDTLHLIPALWEVRRSYPNARIEVLTSPVGRDVLGLVPGAVDGARVVRWPSASRVGLPEVGRAAWELLREPFDAVINFSGADRTLWFTAMTRAPWRVSCRGSRRHFWSHWLIPHWTPAPDASLPVYEQKRQVLAACGMPLEPVKWALSVTPEALRRAESLVPAGAIHFSINASTALKEWPLEHWAALAERLLSANPQAELVATASGSPREQERLRNLEEKVSNRRFKVLPPGLAIVELAAVLQRCRLHVGSDSGVLHLAVAIGLPTISFFRENPGAQGWMPTGSEHRALCMPCECVNRKTQPCAATGESRCLAELSVDVVEREILQLLQP